MSKKKDTTTEKIHVIEDALSKSENFIEKNQKLLTIILGSIILITFAIIAIHKYYLEPRAEEASEQVFMAQKYYEADSLDKALLGDGNYPGFLDIIDQYGGTKSGNLSRFYTGNIYLKQGNYEDAIKYLKKFKGDDEILSTIAIGNIGDAYWEMGDAKQAVNYYEKAISKNTNDLITPTYMMRAAFAYEELGNYSKALELYKKIQKDHYKSAEARGIEKYIYAAEAKK